MTHYDVVIVGSGFGGSVAALRLVEKGYTVGVIEAGRRFEDHELPETSWRLRKYLWAPWMGCYGVQRIHLLPDVLVMAGAGVGGGSLNYANTLYQPPRKFFEDKQWSHITDWQSELNPYYEQARRMLGVTTNPSFTPADAVMRGVAEDMGVADTFTSTPVGVYFGEPGERVAAVLRWSGPRMHGVHRVWQLHDGMPGGCEEHLGEELSVPGGTCGRADPRPDDGAHTWPARRWWIRVEDPTHRRSKAARAHLHRRSGRRRGRDLRNGTAAVGNEGVRRIAEPVDKTGFGRANQLRGSPRCHGAKPVDRLHQGCGDHVVVPSR